MSNTNSNAFTYAWGIKSLVPANDQEQLPLWPLQWAGEQQSYTRTGIRTLNMYGYMIK